MKLKKVKFINLKILFVNQCFRNMIFIISKEVQSYQKNKKFDQVDVINKILFLADGNKSTYEISKRLRLNKKYNKNFFEILKNKGLIEKIV